MSRDLGKIRTWQFCLSGIYVLGCGFRSILPRGDIRHIVLVDSWISSVAIGRSVATVAELCFVTQWALLLYESGKSTGNKAALTLSKLIVPIIFIAEIFSWYACTTTNYLGTAIEESLWAVAASLAVAGFFILRPHYISIQRKFITAGIILGGGYILYMVSVDVPQYISAWMDAEAASKVYLSITDGFHEVATSWRLTHAFGDWKYEMIWMTLYFSLAVWMSLYIINAPLLDTNIKETKRIV